MVAVVVTQEKGRVVLTDYERQAWRDKLIAYLKDQTWDFVVDVTDRVLNIDHLNAQDMDDLRMDLNNDVAEHLHIEFK